MKKKLKILGVHGLGDHRKSTWQADWREAILSVFPGLDNLDLEFTFITYDDIFERVDLSIWESMQAVWKLARSGVSTATSRFTPRPPGSARPAAPAPKGHAPRGSPTSPASRPPDLSGPAHRASSAKGSFA